jgi:hypothetical protein
VTSWPCSPTSAADEGSADGVRRPDRHTRLVTIWYARGRDRRPPAGAPVSAGRQR